jgi:mono/diheme cytochrome c family protein
MTRRVLFCAAAFAVLAMTIGCSSAASTESATPADKHVRPAAAASPAMLDRGRDIYKAYCAACHGDTGRGDGPGAGVMKPPPRDHTDRAYMGTLTDGDLAKTIQMGGAMKGKPLMPSNPQIKGEDLAALVAYTRSLSTPQR